MLKRGSDNRADVLGLEEEAIVTGWRRDDRHGSRARDETSQLLL
jgi:hypothetical protein